MGKNIIYFPAAYGLDRKEEGVYEKTQMHAVFD
jgi:hypothetical protein